jgi:hypothetical protein
MAEADTSPQVIAMPPRFWWLKRIAVAMLLFAGLLVALRYLSLNVAKRRLDAEINAIKARGEPLVPEDFLDRPVAAEDDAGPDLLAATKSFSIPKEHQAAWNPTTNQNRAVAAATVDAVLSANREALAKVRVARGKRIVNWRLPIRSPMQAVRLPMLAELRQLGEAMRLASQRAIREGRHDEAVEYLRDWLMMSQSLESQPMLVSHLHSTAMQSHVMTGIRMATALLRVGNGGGDAREGQVKALIQELLDERKSDRSGWRWAWQGERMMQMELIKALASEDEATRDAMGVNIHTRFMGWWMRPMQAATAEDLLDMANTNVKAAGAKDLPEAVKIVREWETRSPRFVRLGKYSPAQGNLNAQFLAVYDRREAAVGLAVRMFKLRYGRDVKDIQELVPEFLPEAPLDCLRGGGSTMGAGR